MTIFQTFWGFSVTFRVPPERRVSVSEGLCMPPKVASGRMTRARLASERGYRPLGLATGEANTAPRFPWYRRRRLFGEIVADNRRETVREKGTIG